MDLKKVSGTLKDKAAGVADMVSDLKEGGKEKFLEHVNRLTQILPIIAQTGYNLTGLDIEVSIPPAVILQFEKTQDLSRAAIDGILAAHGNDEMLKTIVNALVAANDFQSKVKLGDFKFSNVAVSLGIPPKVNIRFEK